MLSLEIATFEAGSESMSNERLMSASESSKKPEFLHTVEKFQHAIVPA